MASIFDNLANVIRSSANTAANAANNTIQNKQQNAQPGGSGYGNDTWRQFLNRNNAVINAFDQLRQQAAQAQAQQAQQGGWQGGGQQSPTQIQAPSSTGKTDAEKRAENKKSAERSAAILRGINGAAAGGAGTAIANLLLGPTEEAKAAETDETDNQTEQVAPNVETKGSSNDIESMLRNAMGDDAYEQLQQGMKSGEERQADRKAAEKQREEDYQYMIGASPQAQLDRAKLEQQLAQASAQQDRDLLMSGVTDEDAKARYDALLNQSVDLRNSELAEQIKAAAKEVNAEKTGEDKEAEDLDEAIRYYISEARPEGYTKDDLSKMFEDAIYNAAMADEDYRKLFDEAGYGDYGSYAAYGSLGDTLDYDSRREVTRDIFGLDDTQPDLEIQGLKDIYFENGTINDKMTPDEMLDAILEAHWGAGNIINPYQWMSDEAYQAANPFGGSSAAQEYTDYWLQNGVIPVDESGAFGGFEGDWSRLDNEDFATLVAAGNIMNQLNSGWQPTDADLAAMSQVFQNAGDLSSFAYLPTDGSESEYKGREWNANQRANAYAMPQLLQTMAAAEAGDYSGLTPYVDSNMALGDAYMTDTIAKAIEDSTGKKVGRKDR